MITIPDCGGTALLPAHWIVRYNIGITKYPSMTDIGPRSYIRDEFNPRPSDGGVFTRLRYANELSQGKWKIWKR